MTGHSDAMGNSPAGTWARKAIWFAAVPIVALFGGFVAGMVVFSWGLVMPWSWPLAVASAALTAALGAGWIGTLLAPDGTRSRILPIFLASEAASVVAVAVPVLRMIVALPLIFTLGAGVLVVALGASLATWRFRADADRLGWEAAITLAASAIVLALSFASLWGWLQLVYSVPVGVFAVVLGSVLARRRFRRSGDRLGRDAAITLALAGLPAPVFFGAYYLAYSLGMTSG